MRRLRNLFTCALALLMALLGALYLSTQYSLAAPAGGTVGTGTPASCTEAALDAALAGGGNISFNCGPNPYTITLTSQKVITTGTTIDGGSKVTLSGGNTTRLLYVKPGVPLTLTNLILSDGYAASVGGGAVEVLIGTLVLDHSTIQRSHSNGWAGSAVLALGGSVSLLNGSVVQDNYDADFGALYTNGQLQVVDSTVRNNTALLGAGIYVDGFPGIGTALITRSVLSGNVVGGTGAAGGALYVTISGTARIDQSMLASNLATGVGIYGGGIYALGPLTVTNSTLSGNSAGFGGGIYNASTAMLTNVTLSGNSASGNGGGIYIFGGTTTLANVMLGGNSALYGGGMYNAAGTVTLASVTLSGNSAIQGGGIFNNATLTLTNITLSGNSAGYEGGGIENYGGTATLMNVTLSGNSAQFGGGIENAGTATLTNVTLSGNSAQFGGGGIAQSSNVAERTLTLKNTIVANSPSGGNCFQTASSAGHITSNGNNLSDDVSCTAYFTQTLPAITDWNTASANLGPLANNGGSTLTHLPLPGSVAIDHGDGCPPTDQRGVTRPQGPRCDIGAVEYRTGEMTPWLYLPLIVR